MAIPKKIKSALDDAKADRNKSMSKLIFAMLETEVDEVYNSKSGQRPSKKYIIELLREINRAEGSDDEERLAELERLFNNSTSVDIESL